MRLITILLLVLLLLSCSPESEQVPANSASGEQNIKSNIDDSDEAVQEYIDESISFADYELERLYSQLISTGVRSSYYVFLKGFLMYEGEGHLMCQTSDGIEQVFYVDFDNMGVIGEYISGDIQILDQYKNQPFIIQTISKSIEDPRGEIVEEDFIVECFPYKPEAFKLNGIQGADNVYEQADKLREIIRQGDYAAIIQNISYPYTITHPESGDSWTFTQPAEIEEHQNDIFNNKVLISILDLNYRDIIMNKDFLYLGAFQFQLIKDSGDEFRFLGIDPF